MNKEQYLLLDITKKYFENSEYKIDSQFYNLDWDYFYELSEKHKMLTIVYKILQNQIPKDKKVKFTDYCSRFKNSHIEYLKELQTVTKIAEELEISLLLIKGFVLSKRIYGDLYTRTISDLDLVVDNNKMDRLFYALNEIGYKHFLDYDRFALPRINERKEFDLPIIIYEDNFHEYQMRKQVNGRMIKIEIKRGSSAISNHKFFKYMKDNSVLFKLSSDIKINTLSLEDDFIHLCANCYGNNEVALKQMFLRDFMDVYGFIFYYKQKLNWNKILERALEFELFHKIYWVLINLEQIYKEQFMVFFYSLDNWKSEYLDFSKCINIDGLPILNEGELYYSKSSIIDKIFDFDIKKRDRYEYILSNINNKSIKNYCSTDDKFYKKHISSRAGINFEYRFDYNNQNLKINLRFSKENYLLLNKYRIIFEMYSCVTKNPSFLKEEITFTLSNNKVEVVTNCYEPDAKVLSDNTYINVSVDLPTNQLNYSAAKRGIAYNIVIWEKLLNNYTFKVCEHQYTNIIREIGFINIC